MDINFEEQEEKPSIFKKIFIFLIGIFLLILILTYFLFGGVSYIIEGFAGANKIVDNKIILPDKQIVFENNSYNKLLDIYNQNKENEIKVCLTGIYNGNYTIYDLYIPKIYSQTTREVVSEPCYNSIISLHSHPRMFCIPSDQDFKSFSTFEQENTLMMVMCKEKWFTIYPK